MPNRYKLIPAILYYVINDIGKRTAVYNIDNIRSQVNTRINNIEYIHIQDRYIMHTMFGVHLNFQIWLFQRTRELTKHAYVYLQKIINLLYLVIIYHIVRYY